VRRLAPDALRILRCHNAEHVILERLAKTEKNPLKGALLGIQARRLKRYEAAALDNFDLILAITDVDAERFRAMNPRSDERMIVIPAGADIPSELPHVPRKGAGPLRIVHIAAMDWLPNQAGLRWLMSQVLPQLDAAGLDYHLDAVGKNMPDEFLRTKNPRVTVHGFVEDLRPITSGAHLAVVPLHVGGGMRVKILDYWSMGIPVVATRVGAEGLTENGEARAIELADEPGDFAAAIRRLAGDEAARDRLRRTGFSKVAASYGWPALIDQVIGHVERLRSR
jgi:polysaccharide biosynthesis protein PslH